MTAAGLPFEWIESFDPDEITAEIEAQIFIPNSPSLGPAKKSCALKHIEAFRRIAAAGNQRAMVLEDDATLCDGFAARLAGILSEAEHLSGPIAIQLGAGANYYTPAAMLEPHRLLYPGPHVRHTEAYIIGQREAEAYLDWIAERKLGLPIDHALDVMNRDLGIGVLWAEPPLATQGSITGRFRSAITGKSLIRSTATFGWKRFWRFTVTR